MTPSSLVVLLFHRHRPLHLPAVHVLPVLQITFITITSLVAVVSFKKLYIPPATVLGNQMVPYFCNILTFVFIFLPISRSLSNLSYISFISTIAIHLTCNICHSICFVKYLTLTPVTSLRIYKTECWCFVFQVNIFVQNII